MPRARALTPACFQKEWGGASGNKTGENTGMVEATSLSHDPTEPGEDTLRNLAKPTRTRNPSAGEGVSNVDAS